MASALGKLSPEILCIVFRRLLFLPAACLEGTCLSWTIFEGNLVVFGLRAVARLELHLPSFDHRIRDVNVSAPCLYLLRNQSPSVQGCCRCCCSCHISNCVRLSSSRASSTSVPMRTTSRQATAHASGLFRESRPLWARRSSSMSNHLPLRRACTQSAGPASLDSARACSEYGIYTRCPCPESQTRS